MEKKQTAVDWLINEIRLQVSRSEKLDNLYKHAKAIEKEQIIDAWNDGEQNEIHHFIETAEEFYYYTYGIGH